MTQQRNSIVPIIIIGALFFTAGFVTWMNGTLIPYLKIACELTSAKALMVASAFYISYFVMALPMSRLLRATGFKTGMMVGLLVMASGALLFLPAAYSRSYPAFLFSLFCMGSGLTLLQTAMNPFITIVGPIESAAKRISIMGICNKFAGMLAPVVLAAVVLHDSDTLEASLAAMDVDQRGISLNELALRVVIPYSIMAAALVLMALFVRSSSLPEIVDEHEATHAIGAESRNSVLKFPQLVLGALAIFFYVGAEVIAGDAIGLYGRTQGIPLTETKNFTAWTLGAMLVGYIIGIITIPKHISQSKALTCSAIAGLLFSVGAIVTSGYTSVLCIALLGLANALMWPAIWPLAIEGLGRFTKTGSALLIMGIAGGAVLTPLFGWMSETPSIGPKLALTIFLPCYLFIGWYAMKGSRMRAW